MAAIVGCQALVSGWNLGTASYNQYYVDAARSMSLNSHALLFGAFDPGATITLDKLSGFLVPQVLSIWVFGFHPWSTMLPQVLEGMLTVLAGYVIAARWKGPVAGLVAAAAVATTPLLVSMFGRSSEDAMITMCLALAFWCWQSALLSGQLLPLFGACVWVAVGFQAKMMQAWFIIPALGLAYLLAAPHPLVQRIRRALLAGGVTLVLSLAWVTFIQLTPASDRPYIDGTTDNNAFTMVFGYNGFNRLVPNLVPGVVGNTGGAQAGVELARPSGHLGALGRSLMGPGAMPGVSTAAGPGLAAVQPARPTIHAISVDPAVRTSKLLLPRYTTQVGWLYPLAIAGAALTLWPALTRRRRRRRRRSVDAGGAPQRTPESPPAPRSRPPLNASGGTAVALLAWLIVDVAFLSATVIPHATYLAAVSVQIAVFCGVGLVQAARWCRTRGWARYVLPAVVVGQVGWTLWVLHSSGVAPTFLPPTVALLGSAVTVAALCGAHRKRVRPTWLDGAGLRRWSAGGAILVVLLAPAMWSLSNITIQAGRYGDAYGGPLQVGRYADHPARGSGGQPFQIRDPLTRTADPHLNPAQQNLVDYLRTQVGDGTLMVVESWRQAEPYILYTGTKVIPMGGFRGSIDTPTLPQLKTDIAAGRLQFFLLPDPAHSRGGLTADPATPGASGGTPSVQLQAWVTGHCRFLPPSSYETAGVQLAGLRLYRCTAAEHHSQSRRLNTTARPAVLASSSTAMMVRPR